MTVGKILKNIWKNRKFRNIILLIILIIVFVITLIINLSPSEPRKSERVLICAECKHTDMFKFVTIKSLRCPECKVGKMKYGMKCRKCDYEFPYMDTALSEAKKKKISEIRKQRIMDRRCPNCGDIEVIPISNFVWKKKRK